MYKGIDVSSIQGTIDYNQVRAGGIDFVIVKAGERYSKSAVFDINYAGAKSAGLNVGAYWYSRAMSAAEAKNEAESCVSALAGKQLDYPIFYDLEEPSQLEKGKTFCSEIVNAFCGALANAGYYAGLYISRSPLQTNISDEITRRYALWIAEYNEKLNYSGNYGIWQYGAGACKGISGDVDLDYGYVDYPTIIVNGGFNGYGAAKPVSEIAAEVLNGKWGNGDERRQRLEAAGYDYAAVQAEVNKLL